MLNRPQAKIFKLYTTIMKTIDVDYSLYNQILLFEGRRCKTRLFAPIYKWQLTKIHQIPSPLGGGGVVTDSVECEIFINSQEYFDLKERASKYGMDIMELLLSYY